MESCRVGGTAAGLPSGLCNVQHKTSSSVHPTRQPWGNECVQGTGMETVVYFFIIWLGLVTAWRQILEMGSWVLCLVSLSCPDLFRESTGRHHHHQFVHMTLPGRNFLHLIFKGMLLSGRGTVNIWQTQDAHKDTESDNCRLQVCSFSLWFEAPTPPYPTHPLASLTQMRSTCHIG